MKDLLVFIEMCCYSEKVNQQMVCSVFKGIHYDLLARNKDNGISFISFI